MAEDYIRLMNICQNLNEIKKTFNLIPMLSFDFLSFKGNEITYEQWLDRRDLEIQAYPTELKMTYDEYSVFSLLEVTDTVQIGEKYFQQIGVSEHLDTFEERTALEDEMLKCGYNLNDDYYFTVDNYFNPSKIFIVKFDKWENIIKEFDL